MKTLVLVLNWICIGLFVLAFAGAEGEGTVLGSAVLMITVLGLNIYQIKKGAKNNG